ncbi:MAG TPA: hypothetical protein VK420_15430, partial [Longimicrobium sp.]|nr:hypothetical protein [Longimicrobium sp.]
MNIWDWVLREVDESRKAGRHRLAELILRVPQLATDDEHSPLDAVMPEALALARAAKNPWLEVYFRHWNLQSRILHRLEVSEWMTEAAQLLDFAHSDEVRGCPQSVCVTQDFAACFGSVDGPAYVEERLAAASETLARINAQWPCFTCISSERASALLDGARPEETLAFLDRQEAALVAEGQGRQRHRFLNSRCAALLDLGRPEAALELLRNAGDPPDENERKERAIDEARVLAVLGRGEEGAALLPPFERIRGAPNLYRQWAEAVCALVEVGAYLNGHALERTLLEMEDRLTSCGAVRKAFNTAHDRARMALRRSARATALHACARMEALLPKLRRPLGADAELAEIRAEAEALPPPRPVLPDLPGDFDAWSGTDPEKTLE